jgi:uncharacterized protein (TIGR00251 family)
MPIKINQKEGSVIFDVRVIPRSSRSEIVSDHGGALKVKLRSPPVEGAANDELLSLLSKELKMPRSFIEIVSGHTSKTKRVRIESADASQIVAILKAKT